MSVRALAFDVFGTLVDWRTGIAEAFRSTGAPGDPEELADDWRARYRPILAEVNDGARPWGDFDEHGPGSPARADPDADESAGDLHELARRLAA